MLSIFNQPPLDRFFQLVDVTTCRIPIDEEWFDLGPEKMIRARSSEVGQSWPIIAVDEPQHLLVILHRADESFVNGELPAKKRNYLRLQALAIGIIQRLVFLSAKRLVSLVVRFDIGGRAVNDLQRCFVAGLVVVVP